MIWDGFLEWLADSSIFLFQLLIAALMALVNLILIPFNALLTYVFPGLDGALSQFADFLLLLTGYLSWILDAMAIPPLAVAMIAILPFYKFYVESGVQIFKIILFRRIIR